jgi:Flp pilus assembly secretin CpaC
MCACARTRPHGLRSMLVLAGAAMLMAGSAMAETIPVVVDEAKLVKLPERVSTLVIGNPLIADVTLQGGGMMVITGKGYGATNVIALDRAGTVLTETTVEVRGPRDPVVTVYRGMERETYSCAPKCERRITPGDTSSFFDGTLTQTLTRAGAAVGISQTGRSQ